MEFEFRGAREAIVRKVGRRPPSRFVKLRGSLGRQMTTDEVMVLLRATEP